MADKFILAVRERTPNKEGDMDVTGKWAILPSVHDGYRCAEMALEALRSGGKYGMIAILSVRVSYRTEACHLWADVPVESMYSLPASYEDIQMLMQSSSQVARINGVVPDEKEAV